MLSINTHHGWAWKKNLKKNSVITLKKKRKWLRNQFSSFLHFCVSLVDEVTSIIFVTKKNKIKLNIYSQTSWIRWWRVNEIQSFIIRKQNKLVICIVNWALKNQIEIFDWILCWNVLRQIFYDIKETLCFRIKIVLIWELKIF